MCNFCGGVNLSVEKCFKSIRQGKEKARASDDFNNRPKEWTPRKCFRSVSEDNIITKRFEATKREQEAAKASTF